MMSWCLWLPAQNVVGRLKGEMLMARSKRNKNNARLPFAPDGPMERRFRNFLPVVIDVETAGFDSAKDALLEIGAVFVKFENGIMVPSDVLHEHLLPFPGANLDPSALEFTGIDPDHPLRFAVSEKEALQRLFDKIRTVMHGEDCRRAILVGHNAFFDLSFIKAAAERCGFGDSNPFHNFSTLDTVTMGALAYGQTVLFRAVTAAGIAWDESQAHSALYDAERTAELFCSVVNLWSSKS